jgi:sigma-B regulation protein RsbU (phosphoserine phosphatase)
MSVSNATPRIDHIELKSPDGAARRINVSTARMVIGRAPACDICLDVDLVSRQHAELIHDPFGRWWVRDLGSRNGIKVNGLKVGEQSVGPADIIRVGKYELRLMTAAQKPEPVTPALPTQSEQAFAVQTLDDAAAPAVTAEHLSAILEVGKRLATTPDTESRRRLLCEFMVGKEFRGIMAVLMRPDEKDGQPRAISPIAWGAAGVKPYHVSRTLVRAMQRAGKPVVGSNARGSDIELSIDANTMPSAGIACPLIDSDELLYVAIPMEFATPDWLQMAELATTQWRNAEAGWREREQVTRHQSIEKELSQARRILERYLPSAQAVYGCDWHLKAEPCRWVGGDYADVVSLPDGRLYVGVADVCGKGLQAALVAASFHTLMRSSLAGSQTLAEVMKRANAYLLEFLPDESYITMACILTNPARDRVEYFNAGHPSPLIVTSDHSVRLLPTGLNYPLGMETDDPEVLEFPGSPDEIILFYTDGCTDQLNPNGDRLDSAALQSIATQIASTATTLSAAQCVDGLFAALETHRANCLPPDDRTILGYRLC